MSTAQSSGQKAIRKLDIVGVRIKKGAGSHEERAGEGKRAVPLRAISTLPPRRGGAPTTVLSPARRSTGRPGGVSGYPLAWYRSIS